MWNLVCPPTPPSDTVTDEDNQSNEIDDKEPVGSQQNIDINRNEADGSLTQTESEIDDDLPI